MPQHQRTGLRYTAERVARGIGIIANVRREPAGPRPEPVASEDPQQAQRPRTTVDATLEPGAGERYRLLRWGPGEPMQRREDLGVRRTDHPAPRTTSTSLLYFAHHTDVHLCDAQSPARMEPGERLAWINPGTDAGHRPQELCTVQVLDSMVRATNALATSPETGAPMAFCIQTGDNTDNREQAEVRWFVDVLDGRSVTPTTGDRRRYEGVQAGDRAPWAYHPEGPSRDPYRRYGFPELPGFLAAATTGFEPAGIAVPWLTVLGNHDTIWQGTFGALPPVRFDRAGAALARSTRKPTTIRSLAMVTALASLDADRSLRRWTSGTEPGPLRSSQIVVADGAARRPLSRRELLTAYFDTAERPGPVGHGFTRGNVDTGTAYWSRPHGSAFQLVGLDTNNQTTGSEGRVGPRQFAWLGEQLAAARAAGRMVVVFSHHNSWTTTNSVDDDADPGRAHDGGDLLATMLAHPNVILWVNGHSHENRILAHRAPSGAGGFWELNTASCIDFGQQSRTVEVVDNGDGTLSVLTASVDHAAPPSVPVRRDGRYRPEELASLSRELAANDARWIDPFGQRGRLEDRNAELVLPRPF